MTCTEDRLMIKSRPHRNEVFMTVALTFSLMSTCARRRVGCVLVDGMGNVMATGYNGPARGVTHCIDSPCPGAGMKSGEGLASCQAIHAEQNALLQCRDVNMIDKVYCTTAPCEHCVKLLMNTGATTIYFLHTYPKSNESRGLWLSSRSSRKWINYDQEMIIRADAQSPSKVMDAIVGSYGI